MDEPEDTERAGSGGILAIIVLIVAIVLLLFIFREEVGIGTPTTDIAVPDEIPADVATPEQAD